MSDWISVKDRLPEKKGKYLSKDVNIGVDSFLGKSCWAKRKYQHVAYWMPFPELPEDASLNPSNSTRLGAGNELPNP